MLAGALGACLLLPANSQVAYADDVSDAQAALDAAEARMAEITAEHDALVKQAEELQTQIDEALQGVLDAQDAVHEGRQKLGTFCTQEYKQGGISLVQVILESQSLTDLIDNIAYLDAYEREEARVIEEQRNLQEAYNDALDDLNKKKDDQDQAIADAEAKSEEAAQVVQQCSDTLASAEAAAAEAERLAQLQAQAEAMAAAQAAEAVADTAADTSSNSNTASNIADANTGDSSTSGNTGGTTVTPTTDTTGWSTGLASAYGSTSDGALGARTATGAIVTESSMGVAVPMSWPNYRSYFGRSVEISYGGYTVIATVNDCGGLAHGARALDLQPGVWKALGASSCYGWGVRTVSYRFL